jgi:hypothetical protein
MMAMLSFLVPSLLYPISMESQFGFILLIFLMTFILPALNIGFFRMFGTISSFQMKTRRERILPFTFISVLYCVVTYLFYTKTRVSLEDNLFRLLLIIDCLVVFATVITVFYKVSIHSLGICGMLGIIFPLNTMANSHILFYPTLITLVLAGVVMSARLKLNAHTPREVLVGAVTGFSISFTGMILLF